MCARVSDVSYLQCLHRADFHDTLLMYTIAPIIFSAAIGVGSWTHSASIISLDSAATDGLFGNVLRMQVWTVGALWLARGDHELSVSRLQTGKTRRRRERRPRPDPLTRGVAGMPWSRRGHKGHVGGRPQYPCHALCGVQA